MTYFEQIDLPVFSNVFDEFVSLFPDWDSIEQICLTSPKGHEDNHQFGAGSLYYDWSRSERVWNDYEKTYKLILPKREDEVLESDFTEMVNIFKNTVFEEIVEVLRKYSNNLGRIRIMNLRPKTCLTWHCDDSLRIHYPFKTNPACRMVIGDHSKMLEQDRWWLTNTLEYHTALNGSLESRLHIVACILQT